MKLYVLQKGNGISGDEECLFKAESYFHELVVCVLVLNKKIQYIIKLVNHINKYKLAKRKCA